MAPFQWFARSVRCVACAVSWATWLPFTGVPPRCVVLHLRCPASLGACSLVSPLCVLCCAWGVLGNLPPVHRCAPLVPFVVCSVSLATWLLFTGVPARCVVLRVQCPGPLDSRSPVCSLAVVCRVCGVLGHLEPGHRCARMVCSACSMCGVLGLRAPVHWCVRSVRFVACAVSWATCLLLIAAPARCVVLLVHCPWRLYSLSPVCTLSLLCCVCQASLRGLHSSIWTAPCRRRQMLCTPRVRTHPF